MLNVTHWITESTVVECFNIDGTLFLRRQCFTRDEALKFSGRLVDKGSTWHNDRRLVPRIA